MRTFIVPILTATLAFAFSCKKEDSKVEPVAKVTTKTDSKKTAPTHTEVPITSSKPGAIALLREGRALQEGFRFADASKKYKEALELDPDFALGHAQLAALNKGEVGRLHRKRAIELAEKLQENERLLIKTMVAESKEDRNKAIALLAKSVPDDWRVQVLVASTAQKNGDLAGARKAYEKAASLNKEAASPHNNLAYLYAEEGDFKKAVASVTKYAELSPGEPNPLDSKGEILLMAGEFAQSEAAFAAALELSDDFAIAHEGIAATKFYRGDWKGGVAELESGAKKAVRAIDRHELENKLGWALVAAGKEKRAKEVFAAAMRSASEAGIPQRAGAKKTLAAEIEMKKGNFAAARVLAKKAIAAMIADEAPAKKMHWARTVQTLASAQAGDVAGAEKSLAALAVDGKESHYYSLAAARVALAKGDLEGVLKATSELKNDKWFSGRAQLINAEAFEKAGKVEKASKIRGELSTRFRRDIHSVMLAEEAKKAGEG